MDPCVPPGHPSSRDEGRTLWRLLYPQRRYRHGQHLVRVLPQHRCPRLTKSDRAIFHDEKTWKRHDKFLPERFIEKGSEKLPDPLHIAFGYGRRTCGGKEMALDTIWLGVAYILTSFTIHKAKDAQGKEIEPQAELEPGLLW